ncbi:MAG: hypothetical protein ACO3UU_13055, partial [Minisyncoccia bacterium]
ADEQIKLFGTDIYYLPRTLLNNNTLDDIIYSKFEDQFQIEMYLQNVEGFGQSEFISKFGLKVTDEIKFIVSQRRWIQEATANEYKSIIRPLEGDLLFFPLTKDLYEIKFVEVEAVFHQFGKLQFYQITAEIYEMGNESIDTGIADIDLIENILSPAINIVMLSGSGTIPYKVGETVTGSISDVTAKVSKWNPTTRTLTVITRKGTFVEEEILTGSESNAEWEVQSFNTQEDPNTDYVQNKYIQNESNVILDFNEKNPFGEYGNFTGSI